MTERDRSIEVIPPAGQPSTGIAPLAAGLSELVTSVMNRVGFSMGISVRDIEYAELPDEAKKIVDAFMEQIRPEIEEKAENKTPVA